MEEVEETSGENRHRGTLPGDDDFDEFHCSDVAAALQQ
jgi:hypothetical protein